jgi:hypothetical protein
MKKIRPLLILSMIVVLFGGCQKAKYVQPNWQVGDWAEYEVKTEGSGDYKIRYAITGQEQVANETYYWLEMVGESGNSKFVYKMLVPFGYRGVAERMIIQVNQDPPLEMPRVEGLADDPPGENRPYVFLEEEIVFGKQEDEKITVPAGEFLTVHSQVADIRERDVEVWAADVPVLGYVMMKSGNEEMKLVATGHDATTAITGEIQQIDPAIFQ